MKIPYQDESGGSLHTYMTVGVSNQMHRSELVRGAISLCGLLLFCVLAVAGALSQ
jgi:hypothetical protein